jgi:hypothetical protein
MEHIQGFVMHIRGGATCLFLLAQAFALFHVIFKLATSFRLLAVALFEAPFRFRFQAGVSLGAGFILRNALGRGVRGTIGVTSAKNPKRLFMNLAGFLGH